MSVTRACRDNKYGVIYYHTSKHQLVKVY